MNENYEDSLDIDINEIKHGYGFECIRLIYFLALSVAEKHQIEFKSVDNYEFDEDGQNKAFEFLNWICEDNNFATNLDAFCRESKDYSQNIELCENIENEIEEITKKINDFNTNHQEVKESFNCIDFSNFRQTQKKIKKKANLRTNLIEALKS